MNHRFPTLLLISSIAAASTLKAELLVGLTNQNSLITFDSATPSTITLPVSIGGLLAGDMLVGIDRRPQNGPNNGVLYGLGVNSGTGSGRIYTLNVATGAATPGSILSADPADSVAPFPFTSVIGTGFGVDFNPVVDRLRVVSDRGQNLRINVDNGLVQLDVPLAYQSGDVNIAMVPQVNSVAYSNNFGGAPSTVLRAVDGAFNPDTLTVVANPNGGALMTSMALPFNAAETSGYDISGLTGTPYFAVNSVGGPSTLFAAGAGGVVAIGTVGGGVALRGLAAPVGASVPDAGPTLALLITGLLGLSLFGRRKNAA